MQNICILITAVQFFNIIIYANKLYYLPYIIYLFTIIIMRII